MKPPGFTREMVNPKLNDGKKRLPSGKKRKPASRFNKQEQEILRDAVITHIFDPVDHTVQAIRKKLGCSAYTVRNIRTRLLRGEPAFSSGAARNQCVPFTIDRRMRKREKNRVARAQKEATDKRIAEGGDALFEQPKPGYLHVTEAEVGAHVGQDDGDTPELQQWRQEWAQASKEGGVPDVQAILVGLTRIASADGVGDSVRIRALQLIDEIRRAHAITERVGPPPPMTDDERRERLIPLLEACGPKVVTEAITQWWDGKEKES